MRRSFRRCDDETMEERGGFLRGCDVAVGDDDDDDDVSRLLSSAADDAAAAEFAAACAAIAVCRGRLAIPLSPLPPPCSPRDSPRASC